jgi:hypothetical protein
MNVVLVIVPAVEQILPAAESMGRRYYLAIKIMSEIDLKLRWTDTAIGTPTTKAVPQACVRP